MASIPASGQSYYILALDRPLTLDLAGGNPANGTPCLGWTPHFDQQARNRIWTFTEAGLGYWFIQNAATGTALTLAASSPEGSPVVCSSASTGDADRWRIAILPPTPGQVTTWIIENKATGEPLGLADGISDGTKAIGGGATRWILIAVPEL